MTDAEAFHDITPCLPDNLDEPGVSAFLDISYFCMTGEPLPVVQDFLNIKHKQ